jgi:hypothetical protein
VKDLAGLVELNRFVGREFLLWLWFESEIYETNLHPSSAGPIALWLESQLTLSAEAEEARIKSAQPGMAPEAKQGLRQGKLPKTAKLRAIIGENEYEWTMKADEIALSGLKVPAQLKAKEDAYEALYERMMLTSELEAHLEALFRDFIALRLHAAWEETVVPEMKRWARKKDVDEANYARVKKRIVSRRS